LILQAYIQAWREHAPWPNPAQAEHDLIICRALCDLFNAPALAGKIAFRGGTAIHKRLFKRPLRYSEDIDLVQTQAEPIGPIVDAIRDALAWLGKCNREQAGDSMHLVFRFAPESAPQATLKLKVDINTREHEALLGYRHYPFAVASDWYSCTQCQHPALWCACCPSGTSASCPSSLPDCGPAQREGRNADERSTTWLKPVPSRVRDAQAGGGRRGCGRVRCRSATAAPSPPEQAGTRCAGSERCGRTLGW